jgi:protein ImuA
MADDPLPPPDFQQLAQATPEEIATALAYALRYDERGKPRKGGWDFAVNIAADRIAEHLRRSGLVILRARATRDHSAGWSDAMPSSVLPPDRRAALAELRIAVARLERGGAPAHATGLSVCPAIDSVLPGGGLCRAAFHEVLAVDPGAAVGFCAAILARTAGAVVWVGREPDVWPAGLAGLGLPQADLVCVAAKKLKDGLWAFEEALRSPGVAGAVLVHDGATLDLIAARRLQLAAEAGGGIGLLMLPDTHLIPPSAARSRWRVASAVASIAEEPIWNLTLIRASGGRPGSWTVRWDALARSLVVDKAAARVAAGTAWGADVILSCISRACPRIVSASVSQSWQPSISPLGPAEVIVDCW